MFYCLPDSPVEAKFLSDEDKLIAIERVRDNQTGLLSRQWRFSQFFEALWDVKTWLWFAMMLSISYEANDTYPLSLVPFL